MAVKLLVIPDPQLWIYQTYLLLTVAGRFQPLINNAAGIALDIVGSVGFAAVGNDQDLCGAAIVKSDSKIVRHDHGSLKFGIDDIAVHGVLVIVDLRSDILIITERPGQRNYSGVGVIQLKAQIDIDGVDIDAIHINQRQQRRQNKSNQNTAGIAKDLQEFFFYKSP